MTYFITFSCYGSRLHGCETGSVNRGQNLFGSRLLEADPKWLGAEQRLMDQPPFLLDQRRREIVLAALQQRCTNSGWSLLAAHVRTTHVHLVVAAEVRPERIMNDLKSYASRSLNLMRLDQPARTRWARHGSTRWLWTNEDVCAAISYVVDGQGEPMAVYISDELVR